jgi:glycosyltransferase involved in cell wall biosynthesis
MNDSRPFIQVYLLSYNRPEFIREAVDSILTQNYPSFELIVSDNSTHSEVERELATYKDVSKFKYIRRTPSLPALTHINTVLQEARAEFIMLFHDDDRLCKNALARLSFELQNDNTLVAVGSNALIIRGQELTSYLFVPNHLQDTNIENAETLAKHYLISALGHVPFPSYLYRKTAIDKINLNPKEGKKHADVSFLLKLAERGTIRWISEPLMNYRRHSNNDSLNIDIPAILSLCRFIRRNTAVDYELIEEFKMKTFFAWSRQRKKGLTKSLGPFRDGTIRKAGYSFLFYHPQVVAKAILRRIFRKRQYDFKNPIYKK